MRHTIAGRTYNLPEVLMFWRKRRFYKVEGFRPPKRGEWFLSGAIVEAYLATNDLTDPYIVVSPEECAKAETRWVRE